MSLESGILRMLADDGFRRRALPIDVASLDDDAREAFAGVDAARLEAAAAAFRRHVRTRKHRGVGSLEDAFSDALRPLGLAERDDLFRRFLASPAFHEGASPPRCAEDQFARFLLADVNACDPRLVRGALLRAVTRTLAIHGEPAFQLPDGVERRARGWCAVTDDLVLFAAVDGKALEGPVDSATAAMLRARSEQDALAVAATHHLSGAAATRLCEALAKLGLAPRVETDADASDHDDEPRAARGARAHKA